MQKDMHYYALAFLARAAGYNKEESETIAYASQYVDDSTEGDPIAVGDYLFDPVRTAHYSFRSWTWGTQRKIYIPFHFLPPSPHKCNLVTQPGEKSTIAKIIFRDAYKEKESRRLRIIRIGVALHTLADTFSHQGFSGRSHNENVISTCHDDSQSEGGFDNLENSSVWDFVTNVACSASQMVKSIFSEVLPVGHVGAIHNPDLPYLSWHYTKNSTGEIVIRNNIEIFTTACKHLYDRLLESIKMMPGKHSAEALPFKQWDEIFPVISKCISYIGEEEDRCLKWKNEYDKLFEEKLQDYDKYAWRMSALEAKSQGQVMWDKISREAFAKYQFNHNPRFFSSDWVKFHRAAMKQRFLVLFYIS